MSPEFNEIVARAGGTATHRGSAADGGKLPAAGFAYSRRFRRGFSAHLLATSLLTAATLVAFGGAGDTEATHADETAAPDTTDSPAANTSPSDTESPMTSADSSLETDPRLWPTYRSTRYDFSIGHPPDWEVIPSSRDWSWPTDAQDFLSPAHEAFVSPDNDIRVSAWSAPLDPSAPEESIGNLVAWVEDYCEFSENTPCTGIADRSVELCLEARDCHPGLLVPFRDDVQAFFSGGIYDQEAMTIVAVWRDELHSSVAPYGGAQRLLEGFLSTMEVWPATTPLSERD